MRLLAACFLLLCSLHLALAITRYDTVSLQGTEPNGVVAINDGDDAYLGLGTKSRGELSGALCAGSDDGRIVVVNSGGSLSNLPQLAICSGGTTIPFGSGNTYPDYVTVDSTCPQDYRIAEVFDVAAYFQSDKPQVFCTNNDFCTSRVKFQLTAPLIQDCTAACTDLSYTQTTTFTAVLEHAGPSAQQNSNAIHFATNDPNDKTLCVWNKAKIQFLPYTAAGTTFPDKGDLSSLCQSQGLSIASTESLYQYFKSGFDTESAVNFFYLRNADYGAAYDALFSACYTDTVDPQTNFYAPIVYIATADSCPNTTNIPMITSGTIGNPLASVTYDPQFNTGQYSATDDISSSCTPTGTLWPALSQVILSGKGPTFPGWSVDQASFYSNPYVACLFDANIVADLSRTPCFSDSDVDSPLACAPDGFTTDCCDCTSTPGCSPANCPYLTTTPTTTTPTTTSTPTTTAPTTTAATTTQKTTVGFH